MPKPNLHFFISLQHDRISDKLKCPICTFEVSDQKDFIEHRDLHQNYGATQCVLCQMTFDDIISRNRHMYYHVGYQN